MSGNKLLFIGAGKMATAIAGGIVRSGFLNADEMKAFDVNSSAAADFQAATGVACICDEKGISAALLQDYENILIAVKPQMIGEALKVCGGALADKPFYSIAAGVTIETLEKLTGSSRIIRIMPNTPALVGCGAAGFAASSGAMPADIRFAGKVLTAVGIALELKEKDLDAVTALSGSGPAYVFEFIQALADGGVAEGLSRDAALKLAAQTVLGAAQMVLTTGAHPQQLKDNVTSPAGTTSRGLEVMAERGFSGTVIQSVRAAAKRSRELGGK